MRELAAIVNRYVKDTQHLYEIETSNEPTFYPSVSNLLRAVLDDRKLPFEVRTGTSQRRSSGIDLPDFVLSDPGLFVAVFGEVKLPNEGLAEIAASTERGDQIGRYLAQTGVVLVCNVRSFGLLVVRPGYTREPGLPVPPSERDLIATVNLWGSTPVEVEVVQRLIALVERSVTDYAPVAEPASLAKILARQAQDALEGLPDTFDEVAPLLEDFQAALGLTFELEDARGAHFFRSSLVQTAFYSLFAAWVLWDRADDQKAFDLDRVGNFLHIPFLDELFYDLRHPRRLAELGLAPHLDRAIATLQRVDRPLFHQRMTFPTAADDSPAVAAITYFYEPFLEAFDPQLKDELGVWYTPSEIVRYQVRRVHCLLKSELDRPRGFADPNVIVLDPCCGTGAYLLEVGRCIADELRREGDEAMIGAELLEAFQDRIIGFEILTAPFAIAQLQLYILLSELGVVPTAKDRLGIFLTNSLTGWHGEGYPKINFPELRKEYDASRQVKRDKPIIVLIGNPPYDRFAGAAMDEEADLVDHYKGIKWVSKREKKWRHKKERKGKDSISEESEVIMVRDGLSLLYHEFGVRKQLLDDLYIRFFRLAEERIGEEAKHGVVSLISNSSFLTGRSHPIMRRSLLTNFHEVWIDNLNGDKFRTGKLIPRGLPDEGKADQSAFTTVMNPGGIQPGTAISTWLKRPALKTSPEATPVHFRDLWGMAEWKRRALLASLPADSLTKPVDITFPAYEAVTPSPANRWRLSPLAQEAGYESWPGLEELFPTSYQGVNPNRGLEGSVMDTDRTALVVRMRSYFEASSFNEAARLCPVLAQKRARYNPASVWTELKNLGGFDENKALPYLTFPFDQRWIYYETRKKFLNEPREDFGANVTDNNEFLITVPEPRKVSEARPLYACTLVNLHVHDRGSALFPRETRLLAHVEANLHGSAWRRLRQHFSLSGERTGADACSLVGRLFRLALAVLHAPAYQRDHRSALSADWAHLPIPRDAELFNRITEKGDTVARLLDANRDARDVIETVLGTGRAAALAPTRRTDGGSIGPDDLRVAVAYFGGAKGRWLPRPFESEEDPLPHWGERTGDLFISDEVYFANVPEAVWTYELGGYPVLKKWLGYRQASRRGRPLTNKERHWFRSIVQRIAALLAQTPELDALYAEAGANAFTAQELELRDVGLN